MVNIEIGTPAIVQPSSIPADSFIIECFHVNGQWVPEYFVEMPTLLGPFPNDAKHKSYLEEALTFCESLDGLNAPGDVAKAKGYNNWFADKTDRIRNADLDRMYIKLTEADKTEGWPQDQRFNSIYSAGFSHYEVYYYDENLIKHEVKVSF